MDAGGSVAGPRPQDEARLGRAAAVRGLLALVLVAVVALGGGWLLHLEARTQTALAVDLNQAGRQRMLVQRIAGAAATGDADRIRDSLAWLEEVRDHLEHDAVVPLSEIAGPDLRAASGAYLADARAAADGDEVAMAGLPATAERLLPEVDGLVTEYEVTVAQRAERLRAGTVLGALMTLGATVLAWLGVARPGLQALRTAAGNTRRSAELVHQRSEILSRELVYRAALTELAMQALAAEDIDVLFTSGAELIRRSVRADLCYVLEVRATRRVAVRASVGDACFDDDPPTELHHLPQANYTMVSRNPMLVADLSSERRFRAPAWLAERGMRSSMSALIPGRKAPFGVVCVHSRQLERFTDEDLEFLVTSSLVFGSFVERLLAEGVASDQEEQYLRLTQHARDLIFRFQVSPVRRCLFVNEASEHVLGHPPENWMVDPGLLDRLRADAGDRGDLWSFEGERRAVIAVAHPRAGVRRVELSMTVVAPPGREEVVVEGIGRDVTDRELAGRALEDALDRERQAGEELRELSTLKDTFVAAVSHELRTPLTVISGVAETLGAHGGGIAVDQQRQLLERLQANAERLDRLLADLLDLQRLAEHGFDPSRTSIEVHAVIAAVLERIDLDGHEVVTDLEQVSARIDRSMLERTVENLVGNAVKHTSVGTRIWVQLTRTGGDVELVVSDEGSGVPERYREEIFEPFARGPDAPAHAPGHGVGLTLVRRFAELQGGRAWVDDRPRGGAAFHVVLPAG